MHLPRLVYNSGRFIFKCDFDDRVLAKSAGFRWDADSKLWYTTEAAVAATLRDYAQGEAETKLASLLIAKKPSSKKLPPAPEGMEYLPHQEVAIRFAMERNRCYLGLDPGLGKTPCAAAIATLAEESVCVYISPPYLLRNVESEFKRWAPTKQVCIYRSKIDEAFLKELSDATVLIVPDSLLAKTETTDFILWYLGKRLGLLIVDEAHRFKNDDAKRTIALLGNRSTSGVAGLFSRRVYMSGTPMPNRPIELFPILSKEAPETISFMNRFDYGRRYCAGYKDNFGWNFTGASNMSELATRVIHPNGPFMLRMKKSLLKLPPKLEEVFVVSRDMSPRLAEFNNKLVENYESTGDYIKHVLAAKADESTEHVATYRKLLGREKVEPTVEYVNALLEETEESILIFGYHKDVIKALTEQLEEHEPYVITGATPSDERQKLVNEFQQSNTRRVFIGNYLAMGVGFTLTKATRVIFCEFSWVPGENEQASDRAHRIGQDQSVLVQYVVYKDSVDEAVVRTLLAKRRAIKHI